jgi:hypothetical protein
MPVSFIARVRELLLAAPEGSADGGPLLGPMAQPKLPAMLSRVLPSARGPFDLLVVDGPDGLHGRTGALHLAAPWLAPGALVVVDDVARPLMQGMLAGWLRIYRGLTLLEHDPEFAGRGVAVLRWEGGPIRFSLRAWLASVYEALSLRRRLGR